MRYKQPKSEGGANGIYGGVGSRPSPEVWTPGSEHAVEEGKPVPRRFRRIFLRRHRYLEMQEREGRAFPWGLVVGAIVAAVFFLVVLQVCSAPIVIRRWL